MKNKVLQSLHWIIAIFVLLIYIIVLSVSLTTINDNLLKVVAGVVTTIWLFSLLIFIAIANFVIKRKRNDAKTILGLDLKIEELMSSSTNVGLVFYNDDDEIYWTSKFIELVFGKKIIGKKLTIAFGDEFKQNFLKGEKTFSFMINGVIFEVNNHPKSNALVLKDISREANLQKIFFAEKLVLAELEIDNYQQLEVVLPSDSLFRLQSKVIEILDELMEIHKIAYRKYANDKFILILNQAILKKLIDDNFSFLNKTRSYVVASGLSLTISLGVGVGSNNHKDLIDLARNGLLLSQSRGGDQVTLMEPNKQPRYFGAKIEASRFSSRVQIKFITQLLENKLLSKSIKNVIIYGHQYADLDAVGAALGLYDFIKVFNKNVYIQNNTFDATTKKVINAFPRELQDVFIKPLVAKKISSSGRTLVIIVDTAELSRVENSEILHNIEPTDAFIFDHHRAAQIPANIPMQNLFIDTTASSTCEIVCEILMLSERNVKPSEVATQMLLNGIYLDTKQFTKFLSSRTFEAAAWLESLGAASSISVEIMKIPAEHTNLIRAVINNLREITPGTFLASYDGEIPSDVISLICDEILRTQGREAAFVIGKIPGRKQYKMSARSQKINVQRIAEAVGGGGGFSSSAAVSEEPLNIFVDNIIQAIISAKGA